MFGQNASQIAAQQFFGQLLDIVLVLHVLKQENRNRDVAYRFESEYGDCRRHRADASAACRTEIDGIDQLEQRIGQGKILQDGIGELVDAFGFAGSNSVYGADRFRQGRKIGFVTHAAQQKIQSRLLVTGLAFVFFDAGFQITIKRIGKLLRALVAHLRIARQRLVKNVGQRIVNRLIAILRKADIFVGQAIDDSWNVFFGDCSLAAQHFEENQACGEYVVTWFADPACNVFR